MERPLLTRARCSQNEFSAAFRKSPIKRAKLRGLNRNAAVVLGNIGTVDDVDVLTRTLEDPDALAHEHSAWALHRLGTGRAASSHGVHSALATI